MTQFSIVAFDLSLRATGFAHEMGTLTLEPPKVADRGIPRLRWIRDAIMTRAQFAQLVVLEGYAFGAHASHAHELGELGGVVRLALSDAGVPYVDVNPSSLKLFATGKGNANKELVLTEAVRRLNYQGHSSDEADALWLRRMALVHYTTGPVNEQQRKALIKVTWPTLEALTPTKVA